MLRAIAIPSRAAEIAHCLFAIDRDLEWIAHAHSRPGVAHQPHVIGIVLDVEDCRAAHASCRNAGLSCERGPFRRRARARLCAASLLYERLQPRQITPLSLQLVEED